MNDPLHEPLLFNDFPAISTREWEDLILADLKGADYEKKLIWKTYEGIAVRPYYRKEDLTGLEHLKSFPGEYPYVRGNKVTSNRWEIRQDIVASDPLKANTVALEVLALGVHAVGLNTAAVRTSSDLAKLLHGIDLTAAAVHFFGANSYPAQLGFFLKFLDLNGIDKKAVRGSFNADPLSDFVLHGGDYGRLQADMKELVTFFRLAKNELPSYKLLTINAHNFHNAGSSLVQELGYGFAMANEYLDLLTEEGFSIDEISPAVMFTYAVGSDYFPEIAKLRAARWIWSRIIEQYDPKQASSLQQYIHSTTALFNKTIFDPYVNLLRTTTEAMAAGIAGSALITVAPFNEPYALADDFSLRIARNQQIVIQEEAYLGNIVDPAAGSYYIEVLTDAMARESWDIFRQTEERGGFIKSFKQNLVQDEVEKVCRQKIKDIANRKTTVLGTNQYPNANESMLGNITKAAGKKEEKKGDTRPLNLIRGTETLEIIRLATEKHVASGGEKPKVFLFTIGNLAMRKARATFSTNFFGCAGYEIIDNIGFESVEDGIGSCLAAKPSIVVICSSDEEYPQLVPEICSGLKGEGYAGLVVLAGYPKELTEQFTAAGIYEFIHVRTNMQESLIQFNKQLGINTDLT